jgi:uncharacterized protein YoxC
VSPLELRAIAYAVFAAAMVALGVKLGMHHVQAQWNIDKLAQATALSKAQMDLSVALADRVQLQQQVAKQNDDLKAKSDAVVSSVADSVRSIQSALRASALFGSMANTGAGSGASTKPGSNSALEQAFADVGDSIREVTATCLHDAREVTVIQAAAPKP